GSHARRRQVEADGAAQAAHADAEDFGVEELFLSLDGDLRQQQMTLVTIDLFDAELVDAHGSASFGPGWKDKKTMPSKAWPVAGRLPRFSSWMRAASCDSNRPEGQAALCQVVLPTLCRAGTPVKSEERRQSTGRPNFRGQLFSPRQGRRIVATGLVLRY